MVPSGAVDTVIPLGRARRARRAPLGDLSSRSRPQRTNNAILSSVQLTSRQPASCVGAARSEPEENPVAREPRAIRAIRSPFGLKTGAVRRIAVPYGRSSPVFHLRA